MFTNEVFDTASLPAEISERLLIERLRPAHCTEPGWYYVFHRDGVRCAVWVTDATAEEGDDD